MYAEITRARTVGLIIDQYLIINVHILPSKCVVVTDTYACRNNPCQNGGTCNDFTDYYNCTCIAGYTGANCETGTLSGVARIFERGRATERGGGGGISPSHGLKHVCF